MICLHNPQGIAFFVRKVDVLLIRVSAHAAGDPSAANAIILVGGKEYAVKEAVDDILKLIEPSPIGDRK